MGRLVVVLDWLALILIVLAALIIGTDGFVLRVWSTPIRFRSLDRTLLWFVGIVALRLTLDRRTPLFGLARERDETGGFRVDAQPHVYRRTLLAAAAMAAAIALLLHEQLAQLYSVPDTGDPLFSIWRIGWVTHQIFAEPWHLFDSNIFYPERLTLTLSDPMILPALMSLPLAALGLHPVVVYNLLLISGFWLSGVATYLLVERLTGSARAAFIAGLMFACYSYRFDHYSHLELQSTFWMPLALIALHLFVATGRWPYAMSLALAGLAQLYSSMYYGVFLLLYAAVVGLSLVVLQHRDSRRLLLPTAIAAGIAGVLSLPLIGPFVDAQPLKAERSVEVISEFSASPSDYLRPNKYSALWRDRLPLAARERGLFPGAAPIILGVVGLAPPCSGIRAVYAAAGLVSYELSLGVNGWLYPYLTSLPPVRGLRAPARFSVFVGLTLSIFAGFGAMRILRRCRKGIRERLAFGGLAAAVLIDAWPAFNLIPVDPAPPAIYAYLPANRPVVLAELPVVTDPGFNTPFMYFSIWHWRPMVNGYSGYIPRSYVALAPVLKQFPRGDTPALLRKRGVTHVILNCGLGYTISCEETRRLMRQSTELRIVKDARWHGEQVELYELSR